MIRVGFIGLGHMGSHMCRSLITAGFDVSAYDLDPEALLRAREAGARPASSVSDCAAGAEMLSPACRGPRRSIWSSTALKARSPRWRRVRWSSR